MLVSILHRATGTANAIGGGILLVWWLTALAGGAESYDRFVDLMTSDRTGFLNWLPLLVLAGLTWTFLQHMCSGIRHLLLDTGAGYELKRNKTGALSTIAVSLTLTIVIWAGVFARTTF